MSGYVCKVCGFISIDGSAPEKCPVCGAVKTAFIEKEDAINTPKDGNNLSELEKKHIPVVKINKTCGLIANDCQDVQVKIGQIQHPMTKEHYIMHLDFYLDKQFISRLILSAEKLNPAAVIHVKAQTGNLNVIELCNLHGAWISGVNL